MTCASGNVWRLFGNEEFGAFDMDYLVLYNGISNIGKTESAWAVSMYHARSTCSLVIASRLCFASKRLSEFQTNGASISDALLSGDFETSSSVLFDL
jgi:hypothetical protein